MAGGVFYYTRFMFSFSSERNNLFWEDIWFPHSEKKKLALPVFR